MNFSGAGTCLRGKLQRVYALGLLKGAINNISHENGIHTSLGSLQCNVSESVHSNLPEQRFSPDKKFNTYARVRVPVYEIVLLH